MEHFLATYGYVAVFALIFAEACGIPLPGEVMLIAASAYAGAGHLNIVGVLVAASTAAILGFVVSYTVGRTGGRAIVARYGPYVRIEEKAMARAEGFFERHGDKTVFLGRFVAVLRAWAAFLAGLNDMPFPKFMIFNIAGGLVWTIGYGLLAYEFGSAVLEKISKYIGFVALGLVILAAAYLLYRWKFSKRDVVAAPGE